MKQPKFKPIDIYDKLEKINKIIMNINGFFSFFTVTFVITYWTIYVNTGNVANWAIYPYGISAMLMMACLGLLVIFGILIAIKKYMIKKQIRNGIDYWELVSDLKKEKKNDRRV